MVRRETKTQEGEQALFIETNVSRSDSILCGRPRYRGEYQPNGEGASGRKRKRGVVSEKKAQRRQEKMSARTNQETCGLYSCRGYGSVYNLRKKCRD